MVQDWTNVVSHNHIKKKIRGLISAYSQRSTVSVINHSHSFMRENARNIIPKLRKNLLIDTIFGRWERKFIQIAHRNISGNANFATSKLSHTTHKTDDVIHVHTLDQRITAKAEVKDNIQVQTNANTKTETTFELSKIVVIKIPLQKDFNLDEVNFFKKFLNHQFVREETACSK